MNKKQLLIGTLCLTGMMVLSTEAYGFTDTINDWAFDMASSFAQSVAKIGSVIGFIIGVGALIKAYKKESDYLWPVMVLVGSILMFFLPQLFTEEVVKNESKLSTGQNFNSLRSK